MGRHGLSVVYVVKSLMAWLAPTCTMCRCWYFAIIKIMKGLVTPFISLQSREHCVLDGSYVKLGVLVPSGSFLCSH